MDVCTYEDLSHLNKSHACITLHLGAMYPFLLTFALTIMKTYLFLFLLISSASFSFLTLWLGMTYVILVRRADWRGLGAEASWIRGRHGEQRKRCGCRCQEQVNSQQAEQTLLVPYQKTVSCLLTKQGSISNQLCDLKQYQTSLSQDKEFGFYSKHIGKSRRGFKQKSNKCELCLEKLPRLQCGQWIEGRKIRSRKSTQEVRASAKRSVRGRQYFIPFGKMMVDKNPGGGQVGASQCRWREEDRFEIYLGGRNKQTCSWIRITVATSYPLKIPACLQAIHAVGKFCLFFLFLFLYSFATRKPLQFLVAEEPSRGTLSSDSFCIHFL